MNRLNKIGSKGILSYLMLLTLSPSASSSEQISREFESEGIESIQIENDSGNIHLSKHTKQENKSIAIEARIVSTKKEKCDIKIEKLDKKILIKFKAQKKLALFSSSKCEVDIMIKTPGMMDLDISSGSGDVNISEINGKLIAKTGSGNLTATGAFHLVDIMTGSGDVSVKGLTGPAAVEIGGGNGEFIYSKVPASGNFTLDVGSGDVKLYLPKSAKVQTRIQVGSGSIKNELDRNETGNFVIEGNIGSGDFHVKNSRL